MLTTTGIGLLLFSLGLVFGGFRFFKAFRRIKDSSVGNKIGMLLSATFFGTALALSILAIGTLFFAQNSETLYKLLIVSHIPLTLTAMVGMYLVFYTVFPSVSPWPGVGVALALGTNLIILTILTHPRPFIDASGGVNWNLSPALAVSLCYVVFVNIGTQLIVFLHALFHTKSREVRIVSIIQVGLALIGLVNVFIRFFLVDGTIPALVRTRLFDVTLGVIGLIYISIFLLPPVIIKWFSKMKS